MKMGLEIVVPGDATGILPVEISQDIIQGSLNLLLPVATAINCSGLEFCFGQQTKLGAWERGGVIHWWHEEEGDEWNMDGV